MNELRYQVQVICSQPDLEAERRVVEEALVAQNAFVCGFSYPRQTDNYLWKLNQNTLKDADYALVVVGGQYGSLSPTGVGYVHRNFAAAQASGKPILSLIYTGSQKQVVDGTDQKRLAELVVQLKQGNYLEWKDLEDLRSKAEIGFEELVDRHPSRGWVRPEFLAHNGGQEVKALRRQIGLLKKELENIRLGLGADDDSDMVDLPYQCKMFTGGTMTNVDGHARWPWHRVFLTVAPLLMDEVPESKVRAGFFDQILDAERDKLTQAMPTAHAFVDLKVPTNQFNGIKVKLRAQGLITIRQGKWKLTPLGEHRLLMQSEATH